MSAKIWQYCYECGHHYPTARSLRKAYRRQFWSATKASQYQPRTSLTSRVWRIATVKARSIYFCQACSHDFLFNPQSWESVPIWNEAGER